MICIRWRIESFYAGNDIGLLALQISTTKNHKVSNREMWEAKGLEKIFCKRDAPQMVFKMSWKKVFKTAEEAVEYLFSAELVSEMIALPNEVDELTDEEGFHDTETLDPSIRDVICPIIC
ncbi:hypothetical protein NPIL_572121 [Nephila pilipes]|uniref:Uncharacterized protein n=1 Tax=Nephila pilipes TaxID=299642 RepID=A0A8X6ND47_NEPPI|nr:hypothetical protein NPIL_572121 [Nephila pilipes]